MNLNNDVQNKGQRFYRAFEDKFRGNREAIKSRLMVYIPFIKPLSEIYEVCSAIDLGCGRGEWLELLEGMGMPAHGVDLDNDMLAACRERNLSVETGDAISFLKSLPDESQAVVSGFHIIEHIPFVDLQTLIQEALRVLKPAGLLILETPNPENIIVSSLNFYFDPSHLHPIPPNLLSFLTEFYGFYRNKTLRLHEPFNLEASNSPNLFYVLYGVSPDYSVIAQKPAEEEQVTSFNSIFDKVYGLSLETLVTNFDAQIARDRAELFQLGRIQAERDRIQAERDRMQAERDRIQVERDRIQAELKNLYKSRSWRITAPLRASTDSVRKVKHKFFSMVADRTPPVIKASVKRVLIRLANFVQARPRLKQRLVQLFGMFPVIDRMVLDLSRRLKNEFPESQSPIDEIQNQPKRVQQIHKELLDTIDQNRMVE